MLDYTQLENEVQLSSNIELRCEPFSLTEICDQLADIVASRVNTRKVPQPARPLSNVPLGPSLRSP